MKFFLLALLVSAPALAATSGTLLLKGVVPAKLDITVAPTALASNLPLDVTQNNGHVANLTAKWNTINGARVTVTSANGGQLRHTSVANSAIPYTLQAQGIGSFSLSSPHSYDAAVSGPQSHTRAIGINYTGVPHDQLAQGDYTDTVTFTISAL